MPNNNPYPRPLLLSFLSPFWRIVRSYRPHLEVRELIWGDDWSYSLYPRFFSLGLREFSSALRKMSDLCTAPGIISLSPLSLADRRDWRVTRGKWFLARNSDRSWWHRQTSLKFFLAAAYGPMDSRSRWWHNLNDMIGIMFPQDWYLLIRFTDYLIKQLSNYLHKIERI